MAAARSRRPAFAVAVATAAAAGLLASGSCRAETAEALHLALAQCASSANTPAATLDACLSALEARALKGAAGKVERAGPSLSLQSSTGPVRFDDRRMVVSTGGAGNASDGSPRNYYLGALDGSDAQLVLALVPGSRLAAARYWLVAAGGPPVLGLDSLPWPAPGGRLLVAARPADKDRVSTLALYVHAGNRWSQQYRFEAPIGISYSFKSWRADGAAVRLDWAITGPTKACADSGVTGSIQLRDGPYGWDLVPPLPPTCS